MKWNWGTGIALTLVLFACIMTFMVIKASQQRFDLVSENYYEEEMAYQEVIDQKSNALLLNSKAELQLIDGKLVLSLPEDLALKDKRYTVLMYCETDARLDFFISNKSSSENSIAIPFKHWNTGKWIAKVKLNCENVDYYFEPFILL